MLVGFVMRYVIVLFCVDILKMVYVKISGGWICCYVLFWVSL